MEKKTTQRIIGILVALALVIILLPLLFGKKDPVMETVTIKEPHFPDQPIKPSQEITAENSYHAPTQTPLPDVAAPIPATPPGMTGGNTDPKALAKASTVTLPSQLPSQKGGTNTEPQMVPSTPQEQQKISTNSTNTPTATLPEQTEPQQISLNSDTVSAQVDEEPQILNAEEAKNVATKSHKTKQVKTASASNSKKNKPSQIKKIAWAIQLGSFKNKTNARNLTDRLRTAGYKAFMREIKSEKGSSTQTRVYIGPEEKQASAVKLSTKLQQQMNLRGFVVIYKPLEL